MKKDNTDQQPYVNVDNVDVSQDDNNIQQILPKQQDNDIPSYHRRRFTWGVLAPLIICLVFIVAISIVILCIN